MRARAFLYKPFAKEKKYALPLANGPSPEGSVLELEEEEEEVEEEEEKVSAAAPPRVEPSGGAPHCSHAMNRSPASVESSRP